MNKKQRRMYILISTLISLCVIGLTYAFYAANVSNSEEVSTIYGNSSTMEITYTDGTGTLAGSEIAPGWNISKTFDIQNTGTGIAFYKMNISNIVSDFMANSIWVKVTDSSDNVVVDVAVPVTDGTITDSIQLNQGQIENYTIMAYYKNLSSDQTPDIGKSFSFTFGIVATN